MECKYNQDEFCVNADCPMRGDYCPVPDIDGVCQYEDRDEERYVLSSKGCFIAAPNDYHIYLDDNDYDNIWDSFSERMIKFGYVEESE